MFGVRFKIKDFIYMLIAGIFVIVFVFLSYKFSSIKKVQIDDNHPETQKILNPIEGDFIIGQKDAPVEVVFYGDFACHHCMRFIHENFIKLRDDYIFTGKVKFIFRPVITLKRSMHGATFLFCDRRDDVVNSAIFFEMFETKWVMSNDYINALLKILKKKEYTTNEHFLDCLNSDVVRENLKKLHKNTVLKLNIHETPHLFVNYNEIIANKSIFKIIDKEYKKAKNV